MKPLMLQKRQAVKVRASKKRKPSSTKWLGRQLNDQYYQAAKKQGWRSRAAFKLLEMQNKFKLFKPGQIIVDLGAAPGGWSQVISAYTRPAKLILIDLLPIEPLSGAIILQKDFTDADTVEIISQVAEGKIDIIMSDVAPATCGHAATDHLRIINLCELTLELAKKLLKPEGHLIMKIFIGGEENFLFKKVQLYFRSVQYFKPDASRQDSKEIYFIARYYKGEEKTL